MASSLAEEIRLHLAEPFPDSVEKGSTYGEVDAVMIDADIVGLISDSSQPSPGQRSSLRACADQLSRSLQALPPEARPYFERLLRLARRAAT